jgi:hypothetical protein
MKRAGANDTVEVHEVGLASALEWHAAEARPAMGLLFVPHSSVGPA